MLQGKSRLDGARRPARTEFPCAAGSPRASDRLYPLPLQQEVADALGVPLQVIESPYEHDGFLIETDAVGTLMRGLLSPPVASGA